MTLGVTDGNTLYAVRYASDNAAPTLYHSIHANDIIEINPDLKGRLSEDARSVVSEPLGVFPEMWKEVPQATLLVIKGGRVDQSPFIPK